jgi:hypothetical protein
VELYHEYTPGTTDDGSGSSLVIFRGVAPLNPPDDEAARPLRFLCSKLLDLLPAPALADVMKYVVDTITFYAPDERPVALPHVSRAVGRIGGTYERPELVLAE